MTRTLTTNTAVSGITSLNGNSRMTMSGALAIWNANGQTAVNCPVTFGASSTANIAATGFIRLNGGDAVSNFNRIEGATINGPGGLVAINTHELRGFGTINAPITFQNASALRADDGTLTIGGTINEVDDHRNGRQRRHAQRRERLEFERGIERGPQRRRAPRRSHHGGQRERHQRAGPGIIARDQQHPARSQCGREHPRLRNCRQRQRLGRRGNIGLLAASNGGTLEIRDNATFTYGGTVTATGGSKVYAKGFGLNFATTSAINLTASTLQMDETSDFNGPINVAAGSDSTINVQVNRFLPSTRPAPSRSAAI